MLYSDTCFTGQALVRLFVDLNEKVVHEDNIGRPEDKPRFSDVLATFNLLADKVSYCRQLLDVCKVYQICQQY